MGLSHLGDGGGGDDDKVNDDEDDKDNDDENNKDSESDKILASPLLPQKQKVSFSTAAWD